MKTAIYLLATCVLSLSAFGQSHIRTQRTLARIDGKDTKTTLAYESSVAQIRVDCSNPRAKVRTIADGLKLLGNVRPAVLLISGTCRENVVIESVDRITLQGNPFATIDGGSDPNLGAVEIVDSQSIELSNLTITGGGQGVGCFGQSLCGLAQVTIQNSLADGAAVGARSHLQVLDSVIQNNADVGLLITSGSVNFFGGSIVGNASQGVSMNSGGFLGFAPGDLTPVVTIENNGGNGITGGFHNTIVGNSARITGNTGDGVSLQGGSALRIASTDISNNAGHQIRIGDLSIVRFNGAANTVSGSNAPDVVCDPQFSTTRNIGNLAGTTTNCPAELPPTP